MAKLLTPINIGPIALSHRVIILTPRKLPWQLATADVARQMTPGGLVIQSFLPDRAVLEPSLEEGAPQAPVWRRLNEAVRAKGGFIIAQIACGASPTPNDEAEVNAMLTAYRDAAMLARAAAFDGAELDAAACVPLQPAILLLEKVQALIDVWGADRTGVQLAPFAWMSAPEDERAAEPFARLLAALNDMEIAYIHLAGTVTPGRGDLSTSPLGRNLRSAFQGILIASGAYTPADAIAAVESRWADAIGFTMIAGDSHDLLTAIKAAVPQRKSPAVTPNGDGP